MSISDYIYLDCAASNPDPKFCVEDEFANPNSMHSAGRDSFFVLDEARNKFVRSIGAKRPSEIIFTSGATEANNLAIFGIARAIRAQSNIQHNNRLKVITSTIEHESVLRPCQELALEGFDVAFLPVDSKGVVNKDEFKKALTDNTCLVTIQLANSEIGIIQDLDPLVKLAHNVGAFFHTDAVGAFGKIPFDVSCCDVDAASFSGHKIGASKGIGALYLKSDTPIKPIIFGSGQELGLRSGTQNVSGAASMALAAEYSTMHIDEQDSKLQKIRDYLYAELSKLPNIRITVFDKDGNNNYLPNILHVCFINRDNEQLILDFDKHNIEVSGGSACSSDKTDKVSNVLSEIGLDKSAANGAIRISIGQNTTIEDAKKFVEITKRMV